MSENWFEMNAIRGKASTETLNNEDLFHEIDVFRVLTDDWQIQRFLNDYNNEEFATKALMKAMVWKKEFGVYDRTDEYFPREFFEIGDPDMFGKDKEGRFVTWANFRNETPPIVNGSVDLLKQMMVHFGEKIDKLVNRNRYTQVTWLSNTSGYGVSMNGLQLFKFFLSMRYYYPFMMKLHLLVDMPTMQRTMAKLLVAIATNTMKRMDLDLRFVTRQELTQFVDWDLIPAEMGGPRMAHIVVPDNVRPLKELKHFKFSDKELKIWEKHSNKLKEKIDKFQKQHQLENNKLV